MTGFEPDAVHERTQADLGLAALGEPVDAAVAAHLASCPVCRQDLAGFREVAELARAGNADPHLPPPDTGRLDRIWREVERATADPAPQPAATPPRRPRRWLRPALAAAAVVLLGAAGLGGWLLGRSGTTSVPDSGHAALAAQPGTPSRASGSASMQASHDGYRMTVTTTELPAWSGYYEVWLYDPSINQMVAVGTLGVGGQGTFTLPGGIDLAAYHVIDVSAQRFDGRAAHERSVLRGPIAP